MSHYFGTERAQPEPWISVSMAPLAGVLLCVVGLWTVALPAPMHAVTMDLIDSCPASVARSPAFHSVVVAADNTIFWDGEALAGRDAADARLRALGARPAAQQATLHIRPHPQADYGAVAFLLASAQRGGVVRMGVAGESFAVMSDQRCVQYSE